MSTLNGLAAKIHADNIQRGYWDKPELCKYLLLITSEVTEFMEADRKGKSCEGVNMLDINDYDDDEFMLHYKTFIKGTKEEEGADILIRTLDLLSGLGHNIDGHVAAKLRYNKIKGVDITKAY
jgi:hypothetical protein